ncbi:hypothetical protein J2T21_002905 [Paeniglutamicibacter psychrophenolicus]|nr:hypothetical protein [Paeniglutamicibacter psychrophenolicus]
MLASFHTSKGARKMRHEPTSGYEDPNLKYRVTWRSVEESGKTYEEVFTSRDQGWDFYQDMQMSPRAYGAKWEHIPT